MIPSKFCSRRPCERQVELLKRFLLFPAWAMRPWSFTEDVRISAIRVAYSRRAGGCIDRILMYALIQN